MSIGLNRMPTWPELHFRVNELIDKNLELSILNITLQKKLDSAMKALEYAQTCMSEECRNDEDCDHCQIVAWIKEIKEMK